MLRGVLTFFMTATLVTVGIPGVLTTADSPSVIQLWYQVGYTEIAGSRVWSLAETNFTMDARVFDLNGSSHREITEFHVGAYAPGPDAYPPTNGTNPVPFPWIYAIYDTAQVVYDSDLCVQSNSSVGFECNVARGIWEHQVAELRLLRLLEFDDADEDGKYAPEEPILSQQDLSASSLLYAPVTLDGLNETGGVEALQFQLHDPNTCCGEFLKGWVGQADDLFASIDGLKLRISGAGPPFLNITAYQWREPRSFMGFNVTPFQVKLDFEIAAYPYLSTDSRLALHLSLTSFSQSSELAWTVVPWEGGEGIVADSANMTSGFLWSSEATVDGVQSSVIGTVVSVDTLSRDVYLSYSHGALIEHDPFLGLEDKRLSAGFGGPSMIFTWMAFGTTLASGAAVVYVIERRKK